MQTLYDIIPDERLEAINNALFQTFNTTEVKEITLLTGGLSSATTVKIVVNDQPYVLKLNSTTATINNDLLTCMEIAADAGIAPPVYYLNKADGTVITGFIKNTPLKAFFKSTEALLPQLAKTIRRIHGLPAFPKGYSLLDTINGLIAQFKLSKMLTGPVFDTCFAYYELIMKHYPWHDTDTVSCHNDLNPNNIVFDGEKIWIIDWDAAYKNDRYVDLAITANFYVTTNEQENIFLRAYFGNTLTDYHEARFFLMRQICRLVYAMLMFKLAHTSRPAGVEHDYNMRDISLSDIKEKLGTGKLSLAAYNGQLAFGKALLNEAFYDMISPRFSTSIATL